MENSQLVTIAVTAVISVVSKEIIIWLVSLVKTLSVMSTIKEKVKAIFSPANIKIILDVLSIAIYTLLLAYFASDSAPPTRITVLILIVLVVTIVFLAFMLMYHVQLAKFARTPITPPKQ